jgi:hypothetical protein
MKSTPTTNSIKLRSFILGFTQIAQEIWKLKVEIPLSTTFKKLQAPLRQISRKSHQLDTAL